MVVLRIALLAVVLLSAVRSQATTKVYRYLEESLRSGGKNSFRDFIAMVNMHYFRMFYPQAFGVPRWPEFLAQQQAEGVTEERASTRYHLALRGDPLSEDGIRTALMQDEVYRAHVFAYVILSSIQPDTEYERSDLLAIANASQTVVPLVMAIDADYSLTELLERALHLLQHKFNFYTHRDLDELSDSQQAFGHLGNYLMRSRKAEAKDAGKFQAIQLHRLGFTAAEIAALSYRARDAIIISAPASKDDFVSHAEALLGTPTFDIEAINAAVAARGSLVYVLTSPPYDYELDAIKQHDIDTLVKVFNFQ